MEFNKQEIAVVEVAANSAETDLIELDQLQLSVIGGGVGEVLFG